MFPTLQLGGRSFPRPVLFLLVLVSAALAFQARGDPPVPAAALPTYAATTPAPATGTRLATVYRYGGQWNEWFVRGDATVSASPTLVRGARLSAWDGDNPGDLSRVAVATAVYLIPLPPESQSFIIEVGYQPQDTARNKTVAGFLFVRDRTVERQYAAADSGKTGPFDEPGFYGDTYLLPAGQVRAAFDMPAADCLSDGILEVHVCAGAGQVMDVQYIQVTAQTTPAPAPIAGAEASVPAADTSVPYEATPANVQYVNPYDYSYTYYYTGPWFWPYNGFLISYPFCCDDFDWLTCGGWYAYRCCFWNHHGWCFRPEGVSRADFDGDRDDHGHGRFGLHGAGAASAAVSAYRADWLQRNFHVTAGAPADVVDMARQHRSLLAPSKLAEFKQTTTTVMQETARMSTARRHETVVSASGQPLTSHPMTTPAMTPFQSQNATINAAGGGRRSAETFGAAPVAPPLFQSAPRVISSPRFSQGWSGGSERSSFTPAPSSAPSGWSGGGHVSSWGSSGRSSGFSGWSHSAFTSGGRTGSYGGRR